MFVRLMLVACGLLLSCNCNHQVTTDMATVAEQIEERPVVTLVPVIDSAKPDLNWNVSHELTGLLLKRLSKRDRFSLTSPQKVAAQLEGLRKTKDPFGLDVRWMKPLFQGTEFVVFVELLEHSEEYLTLDGNFKDSSADLNLTVRLRAVDLRGDLPKIALQEVLHETHHLPKQFTQANFHQVSWKSVNFGISPLGLAHVDLIKTVASRLEDHIARAKQN